MHTLLGRQSYEVVRGRLASVEGYGMLADWLPEDIEAALEGMRQFGALEVLGRGFWKQRISARLLITDFVFFNVSFFSLNYYKRGTIVLNQDYEKLLLIYYGLWVIASFITRKFDKDTALNYWNALASCIKSILLMTSVMAVLIFALGFTIILVCRYSGRWSYFSFLSYFFIYSILLSERRRRPKKILNLLKR